MKIKVLDFFLKASKIYDTYKCKFQLNLIEDNDENWFNVDMKKENQIYKQTNKIFNSKW